VADPKLKPGKAQTDPAVFNERLVVEKTY